MRLHADTQHSGELGRAAMKRAMAWKAARMVFEDEMERQKLPRTSTTSLRRNVWGPPHAAREGGGG